MNDSLAQMVRTPDCQCQSRNSPGSAPSILLLSGISEGATDEAVYKKPPCYTKEWIASLEPENTQHVSDVRALLPVPQNEQSQPKTIRVRTTGCGSALVFMRI